MLTTEMSERCLSENEIVEHVRGVLDDPDRRRVDAHIDRCSACRELVSELAALLVGEPASSTPGEVTEADEAIAPQPERPIQIDRYVVLERLGAGGSGVVFAAYDSKLDRKVALKLIPTHSAGSASESRDLILRGAQAQAQINHRNVVAIHDVGTWGIHVWLAMELVAGRSLSEWSKPRRAWREVIAVFGEAGEGLAAVHAAGLVHRDFKPDNVMIGDDGRVRLMDFGLARGLGPLAGESTCWTASLEPAGVSWRDKLTRTGALLGTPAYMAAEQWAGAEVDARTDVFAFCVSVWEALHGERPFAGSNARELASNVADGRLRSPQVELPSWLRRSLERGLDPDPARRWPSMRAVLDAWRVGLRRRRIELASLALLGVSAVLAGALGIGARVTEADREATCRAEAAELEPVWNARVAASIREGFAATERSFAARSSEGVVAALDEYALAWSRARGEACRLRQVEPAFAEAAPEVEACLLDARWLVEADLELLLAADAQTVELAVQMVASLPRPRDCLELRRLDDRASLPSPGPQRERAEHTLHELARVQSLYAAGRYVEAMALAQTQIDAAEGSPLAARAQVQFGIAAIQADDPTAAERALEDGFFLAQRTGSLDVALRAATKLTSLVALERRPAEGLRWGRWAELLLDQLEGEGSLEHAYLLGNLAIAHYAESQPARAVALAGEAIAILERELGPEHPDVAVAYANLAVVHSAAGSPREALAAGMAAIRIAERALGPEHPDVALYLDTAALAAISLDDPRTALQLRERALRIAESAARPDSLLALAIRNNLAWTLNRLGRPAAARRLYEQSLALARSSLGPEHSQVASTLDLLGECQRQAGDLDAALASHERAMQLHERNFGIDDPARAQVLLHLGEVHRAAGRPEPAIRSFEQALAIYRRVPEHDPAGPATAMQGIGQSQLAAGELDLAALAFADAASEWAKIGSSDRLDALVARLGLADVALAGARLDDACAAYEALLVDCEARQCSPLFVADLRFGLARAIVASEPIHARELAEQAAVSYRAAELVRSPELATIEAWQAAQP